MTRIITSTIRLSLLLILVLAPAVPAEVKSLTVSVDGMACPFCTYGVEKKLNTVDGVESVVINLGQGTAELALAGNSLPTAEAIRTAVRKAGFTAGTIRLTALGTLTIGTHHVDLNVRGSEHSLRLHGVGSAQEPPLDTGLLRQFSALEERGAVVAVTGTLRGGADQDDALSVETVEEVHGVELRVEGMRCEQCVSRVTALIEQLPGVYRARVSLADKRAVIESIGRKLDARALISVLDDAGFDAELVPSA